MKRGLSLLMLLFAVLFFAVSLLAQDDPVATDELTPTVEVLATVEVPDGAVVTPDTGDSPVVVVTTPAAEGLFGANLNQLVLAFLLVLLVLSNGRLAQLLAKLIPAEFANGIVNSGLNMGLQYALNTAAATPGKTDDDVFIELAKLNGYKATLKPDGSGYDLTKLSPPGENTVMESK